MIALDYFWFLLRFNILVVMLGVFLALGMLFSSFSWFLCYKLTICHFDLYPMNLNIQQNGSFLILLWLNFNYAIYYEGGFLNIEFWHLSSPNSSFNCGHLVSGLDIWIMLFANLNIWTNLFVFIFWKWTINIICT